MSLPMAAVSIASARPVMLRPMAGGTGLMAGLVVVVMMMVLTWVNGRAVPGQSWFIQRGSHGKGGLVGRLNGRVDG